MLVSSTPLCVDTKTIVTCYMYETWASTFIKASFYATAYKLQGTVDLFSINFYDRL